MRDTTGIYKGKRYILEVQEIESDNMLGTTDVISNGLKLCGWSLIGFPVLDMTGEEFYNKLQSSFNKF